MARNSGNNFRRAMDELLNPKGRPEQEPEVLFEEPRMAEEERATETTVAEEIHMDFSFDAETMEPPVPVIREEAVITSDMVITGNITTKSNMKILGSIVGDVDCEGSIYLQGSIQGSVLAGNLTMQHGYLNGDASVRETIVIEGESVLRGNLKAQNVYSSARSEGQILAAGNVELKENAYVVGDISARTLSVSNGAKIKGMVDVNE